MEIKSLELQDFRQFYGTNKIKFSHGNQNVTIILGANGNGKTGIFRAIMFALYGDTSIGQDENLNDINLVNLNKLEENKGFPVEAKIKLEFNHEGLNYIIERSLQAILTSQNGKNETVTKEGDVKFYMVSDSGDIEEVEEDVEIKVNEILHKDIREFFFFDAEKMGLLNNTKSKKRLSSEVKEGLMKLLQIKSLDNASSQIKTLISDVSRERSRKAKDGNINQLEDELSTEKEKLVSNETHYTHVVNNIFKAEQEIVANEERLSSNTDIRDLQEKKKILLSGLKDKKLILDEQKNNGLKLIRESVPFLLQDYIQAQLPHFMELKDKQKDNIPLDLMEMSISSNECQLCHHDLETESLSYKRLVELVKQYAFSDITPVINEIQVAHQKMRQGENEITASLKNYIQKIVSTEEQVEKVEISIQKIDDQIKGKAELLENLKAIEEKLEKNKEQLELLRTEKIKLEYEIKVNEERIEELSKQIQELSLKHEDLKVDSKVIEKLNAMKVLLENVTNTYTSSITEDLSFEMTKIFKMLLSDKDKELFSSVVISPNYDISILDSFGNNRVQDLSMGQGQIFTLSFITSLAKLASRGRDEINFPLFMDTPFGRISGENRDNLIKEIPELTNQWILLLTDTELTRIERDSFDTYNKVSEVYELVNIDGKTTIVKKNSILDLKVRG